MLIDGIPLLDFAPPTLLAAFVLAILTGRLVPRRTYDDMREERDTWRGAAERSDEQSTKLLANSDLTVEMLKSITRSAADADKGGGRT